MTSEKPPEHSTARDGDEQRRLVRERYAEIATDDGGSCCEKRTGSDDNCCDGPSGTDSERLGYTPADVEAVSDGADLGLGCGNPNAIADLDTAGYNFVADFATPGCRKSPRDYSR